MLGLIAAAYLQLSAADAPALLHWAEECAGLADQLTTPMDPPAVRVPNEPILIVPFAFSGCMNELADLGRDGEAAAASIRPLLEHPDLRARSATLRVLGYFGDTASLPEVREHLDATDWFETLAAIDAIALLGGTEDVDRLEALAAGHWLAEVRTRAWAAANRLRYSSSANREPGSDPIDDKSDDERLERSLPAPGLYPLQTAEREICPSEAFRFRNRVLSRQEAIPGPAYEAPSSLAVLDGEFRYSNNGEWGGELDWREGSTDQRLITDNIVALIPLDDQTFIAVTGLVHLGFNGGALYRVSPSETGWDVTEISSLPSVPYWAAPMGDGLIGVRTDTGLIVASQDAIIGMGQCEPGPLAAPWR
ncbi:HEAT repeat domain-containing protein [uncultured Maricaulis sp.]|uniref:HEAT repeat domain-containing protein n=1 Tax=uncultured Maricaulis sp. TaxID=174710 RepID=UPI0030D8ABC4|tara:strand:- start:197489 stop:198580 length:1092 start_codon:yes stop_codon:yes gene_type:complete